mmetsp:Transcript_26612/g.26858  ORF Transcript_26612/g.26858 Transcript_26612/m.26858 type:complete len:306 (-) Transcript_26612:210-1127(-)|eukprot:CAMPEP_0182428486 /NCGR_PEP_ID=MMETSP1167-20130531/23059_1 /TAXON_ID=2988 /ORGANISM="Mallomonas Sp, Strain CCMP3275" /LENGTH=305 /DNA_ID=CAMNT_0024611421 /DNA_START=40 /DNA_END=957 /DNA_ORIENTATION=+
MNSLSTVTGTEVMDKLSFAVMKVLEQSKASPVNLAVSGLAATAVLGAMVYSLSGTSADESGGPWLPETESVLIMSQYLEKLKSSGQKLLEHAEQIRQQFSAQGQRVDESQLLKSFLLPNFDNLLVELDSQLLQEYDLDEDELKESVEFYIQQGNMKLKEIISELNKLYQAFGGELDDEHSSLSKGGKTAASSTSHTSGDLTLKQFLNAVAVLTVSVTELTNSFLGQFKERYGVPNTQEGMQRFQLGLMTIQQESEAKTFSTCKINSTQFTTAMEKYQNSSEVQTAINALQEIVPRLLAVHEMNIM